MDDPSADQVRNFALWERAVDELHNEGYDVVIRLLGDSQYARAKRDLVINAARQQDDAYIKRVQAMIPFLQLAPLIRALRIKYVELRLGGS